MLKHLTRMLITYTFICFSQVTLSDKFIVGVEDLDYYPIYGKRNGEYAGFARELLDMYAKENGHTFEYKMLPIKRLYNDFIKNKYDLKFPDNAYWRKDDKKGVNIVYSQPTLEYIDGVLVTPENLGKGKATLKTLAAPRGFTPWDYKEDIDSKKIKLKESNTLKGLVKMAESNRVDGVYFNIIVARYFLENTEFNNNAVIFDEGLPHTKGNYHLSSINHPEVIKSFDEFLAKKKDEIEALKAKYNVTLQ